jgi:putative ABC transport system permease protein
MKAEDVLQFSFRALSYSPTRTFLMLLSMSIGISSVMLLTALGEGARRYVVDQFGSMGTNILIVLPGRFETVGSAPPLLGKTARDLTLEDALALNRSSAIRNVAPIALGTAPVSWREREREVMVLGSTPALYQVRQLSMSQGSFIPEGDPTRMTAVCVLGYKLKRELFGQKSALGTYIRIGDRRFRVTGIMAKKGQSMGLDMGDVAVIPVASALNLFNTSSLFRILIEAGSREAIPKAEEAIQRIIRDRHEGEEDVTIITQDALVATFDDLLLTLTLAVAGIASISLTVAGILIMNVMLIAVSQRTSEIGLLKALGAPQGQILGVFLTESAMLSLLGAGFGLGLAYSGMWVMARLFPAFPIAIPLWAIWISLGVSLAVGMIFGAFPAHRAAKLDPVEALSRR